MVDNKFEIRLLKKGEEKALAEFRLESAARHLKKHDFPHWQWQYCHDNNFSPSTCYVYVCWHKGEIVGQRPLMPFKLNIKGHSVPAVWGTDFLIHPEYRGMGIGGKLMKAVLDDNRVYVAISSGQGAINIYKKFEAILLPKVQNFYYPHRISDYLDRRIRLPLFSNLISSLANRVISLRNRFYRQPKQESIKIEKIFKFDSRFEKLWQISLKHELITTERTLTFLDHRFNKAPSFPYQIIVAVKNGIDAGYVVWRKVAQYRFLIIDAWSRDLNKGILKCLISEVLKRNQSLRGEFTSCIASHNSLKSSLKACGFVQSGSPTMAVHPAKSGINKAALQNSDAWYVTSIDSDIDPIFQFHAKSSHNR